MKTIFIRPTGEMIYNFGRGYVAVLDGNVIASHFCSSDDWAKKDLGIYNLDRKRLYIQMYPLGFEVVFSEEILEGDENEA